jgi:hypothetical protein
MAIGGIDPNTHEVLAESEKMCLECMNNCLPFIVGPGRGPRCIEKDTVTGAELAIPPILHLESRSPAGRWVD